MAAKGAHFPLAFALAAAAASPAFAAPERTVTAEEAVETQQRQLRQATGTAPCPRDAEGEDIVVCGRRPAGPRAEFPEPPGQRVALLPGEPPSAAAALRDTSPSSCSTVGPNQRCSGGLDVFRVVGVLAKIGKHLLDPDD